MANKNLAKVKSQLQKIAQEIEAPAIQAPGQPAAAPEVAASPEQVMELVEDAIEILEVAEEAIPAEAPAVEPEVTPSIGARKRFAQDDDDEDDDKDKKDKKEKDAKVRRAQDQETSENDERQDEEDTPEEDLSKEKQLTSRIRVLEAELDRTKKAELASEFAELYPENIRQAKYDEISGSKESIVTLQRDYKIASELKGAEVDAKAYTPVTQSTSGYLSNIRKASKNTNVLAPWKV